MLTWKAPTRLGYTICAFLMVVMLGGVPAPAHAEGADDTDQDNLTDEQETGYYGTYPMIADSDGDGLLDGQEIIDYGTNPLDLDTDDDGYPDGWEVSQGYNPLLPAAPSVPDGVGDGGGGGGDGQEVPKLIPDGGACIEEPDECIPIMKPEDESKT